MKWLNFFSLASLLILSNFLTYGQPGKDYKVMLRSGSFTPEKNISHEKNNQNLRTGLTGAASRENSVPNQKSFVIIQFEEIPTQLEREQLKTEGIELLEYIPNYAYTATISGSLAGNSLARTKGRAIFELSSEQKMEAGLANGRIPFHAIKSQGHADVWISFAKSFTYDEVQKDLHTSNFEILSDQYKSYQVIALRVPVSRLAELAGKPYVQYVQPAPQEDKAFNHRSLTNSRGNVLSSTLPNGRNLTGDGVVIGIGDECNPVQHLDFNSRVISRTSLDVGTHGIHVMGTMAGAGVLNERFAGYAPKATMVVQNFSNIIAYSPEYVKDFGMVVTNNSYGGDINTCETFGVYDLYSYVVDRQAFQLPYLQHVFATGNSGSLNCSPYPAGFANVPSGFQTAKNVISVGYTNDQSVISTLSSKGPVRDGRMKPEITALGTGVMSSIPVNLYGNGSGSSMSSPAVAGGLALLYQRYRQLFSNNNPKNGLMKALLINGADDRGNEGPDYKYGFGWLNLLRSVKMLEAGNFVNDSLAHNETKTKTISIPSGTAQLKVMLYWNDPAAPILSSKNLVHDLDLTVKGGQGNKVNLPGLLDPTPANVNNAASTGVDNLNNMEQVLINNPTEGDYVISVKGSSVAQNPLQEYFIVYDIIPNSITLTYPGGNEKLRDGDVFFVSWDSFGNVSSTFTVQYSANNGGAWTTIGSNLAANLRQFSWTIPNGITAEKAKIKVIQNSTGAESVSEAFTIIGIPTVTLSSLQCEGYISLDWTSVSGATDYEVMILKGKEMVRAAITNSTNYVLSGLLKDSTYYVSVRARINGLPGRRALAISRRPDSGTCQGNISNNDFKIESILTPTGSGRKNTSSELGNPVFVKIRIKNLDDVDLNVPIDVGYDLNGVAIPSETITPFIEKGKTYDHTFEIGANLSNVGDYTFKIYMHHTNDKVTANDTLLKTFRQLGNDPIALPFLDDMESLPGQTVVNNQTGLKGDGRYDFSATSDAGRIRTFVNSGIAHSGQKALTLDANRYFAAGNTNYLEGTFNLSSYDIEESDVRLNFRYKNHGQKTNASNKVWIRAKDTDPWIEAFDLFFNQNSAHDGYKTPRGIEVSNLLAANGKNFSSSFQVRWGQWGKMLAADYSSGAGYTFDDVELFSVVDDLQMIGLVAPSAESCGLGQQESVTIRIRNSSSKEITNIPVIYQLSNGVTVEEIVPSIGKRATVDYTFSTKADLSAFGALQVKAWSGLGSDGYRDNDTMTLAINNAPVISSFPYIENFDKNDGYWFAKGTNSSWQHGAPISAAIKMAASGSKIWKTNLAGTYRSREESYLYSPCFELGTMAAPTLSFSAAIDLEVCSPTPCDIVYIEYSGNGGAWTRLGSKGQGVNWYDEIYSGNGAWSKQDNTRWHVATTSLPTGFSNLKLRFVIISDGTTQREGIALDDIHIYDKPNGIYDGGTMGVPVAMNISGGKDWVHFIQNGQILASVNPNNQNLGNTDVQAYINTSAVRNVNSQYYLDRNYTIKPFNNNPSDSVSVRLYMLNSETDVLVNAVGCVGCGKPVNAYEVGIAKYRHNDKSKEDGQIANSTDGIWSFHPSGELRTVPFDKGYYVEMKVKNFSEFWFSKAALATSTSLPVDLVRFEAKRKDGKEANQDVLLEWETSSEENFQQFDLEVAIGNEAYRQNQFVRFAEIPGNGALKTNRKYVFTDTNANKVGVYYYRLKMVDNDGSYKFSSVRPVVFDEIAEWTVYPNPSNGLFYVNYQADAGKEVSVNIYDLNGRVFKKASSLATGFLQKSKVDISGEEFTEGSYVLEIDNGKEKHSFQVLKN